MSHLSRDERLLALDDALPPGRGSHLAECAACRTDVETLAKVVARVRASDVPEPSPLFWDYLATRVSDAIAREPLPAAASMPWWRPSRYTWAAAGLAALVVLVGYLGPPRRPAPPAPVAAHVTSDTTLPAAGIVGEPDDAVPGDEDGWGLIAAIAAEGGAAAFDPQVGQSELSISSLTAEERAALVGELEAAIAADGRKG